MIFFNRYGEEILKDFYNSKDHNFISSILYFIFIAHSVIAVCGFTLWLFFFLEKVVKKEFHGEFYFAIEFSKFIKAHHEDNEKIYISKHINLFDGNV